MALFESKETKAAKRKIKIRGATKKVERYVANCRKMSTRYFDMAKRALKVNDAQGCDQYLYSRLLYMRQADKWSAFLLRMEDLAMRGEITGAMNGMMDGLQALTKEMQSAASPKAMAKTVADLNLASERLGHAEEMFSDFMSQLETDVGSPLETEPESVPEEMRDEIAGLRRQLIDELSVQESDRSLTKSVGDDVDERIGKGLEHLRNIRGK